MPDVWASPLSFLWLAAAAAAGLAGYAALRARPRVAFPPAGALLAAGLRRLPRFVTLAPPFLRVVVLVLAALALARPQRNAGTEEVVSRGVSIVLAFDTSQSMLAEDFAPDRITSAREAGKELLKGLAGHAIGVVLFAGRSFLQCPLTNDHDLVREFLDQIECGAVGVDGTAIGEGLLAAVNRLEESRARSRVVVLLTDGLNNQGTDPRVAARAAAQRGVRVYTIGIGRRGGAQLMLHDRDGRKRPVWIGRDWFGRQAYTFDDTGSPAKVDEPDEALLSSVAATTGGRFYRVTDAKRLPEIFREIAALEKTEIRSKRRAVTAELFSWPLAAALALLALEFLWRRRFASGPFA